VLAPPHVEEATISTLTSAKPMSSRIEDGFSELGTSDVDQIAETERCAAGEFPVTLLDRSLHRVTSKTLPSASIACLFAL
jgi:hypothetical protein